MTAAQRLRLVLALGVVNLVLAAVALSVGIGGLTTPSPIAQGPTAGTGSPPPGVPAPSEVPLPSPTTSSAPGPTPSSEPQPSAEPTPAQSPVPSEIPIPSAEPSSSPVISEPIVRPVVVAGFRSDRPAPAPDPTPDPTPTPDPSTGTPDEPDEPVTCDRSPPTHSHAATPRGKAKGQAFGTHGCPPQKPDHAGPQADPLKDGKPPKPPKAQRDKPRDHPPPHHKAQKPHKQHKPHHDGHPTRG